MSFFVPFLLWLNDPSTFDLFNYPENICNLLMCKFCSFVFAWVFGLRLLLS